MRASDPTGPELHFTLDEYRRRLERLHGLMDNVPIDVLLVTSAVNIYYLTGFQNSGQEQFQCLIVPRNGDPHFVIRELYFTAVGGLSWTSSGTPAPDGQDILDVTVNALAGIAPRNSRIGYDDRTLSMPPRILDGLRQALRDRSFTPAGGLIEACRLIKSLAEIECIRRACALSVAGMEAGLNEVQPGKTENDIMATVYDRMIRLGSEYVSCQPIVVSGSRNPPRRGLTEGRPLVEGESIWFEASASFRRYGGAIMRTFVSGRPSAEVKRISDIMIAALNAILDTAGPGVSSGTIDRAGRRVVEEAGLGDYWIHRAGYSIGVGFPPTWTEGDVMDLKAGDSRLLEPGMTFHTVPWVLMPGIGAIGNSETWCVTDDGIEVLTDTPRELRIVV